MSCQWTIKTCKSSVKCAHHQIDEVESSCSESPTKMIRKLISIFFGEEVVAKSSCYGSRGNAKLDEDVVAACIIKQNMTTEECMHALAS